ncbi:transposase family protein [Bradyrhizobium hipponense]|uniref:Transposase family protein n=1 Tax=Bradyrhizobium hipponense TaxID=2605638 RepID=A0A5S4YCM3_9BRAD|nr:DDE-type integrase/transposase/recombinase [Bradyrhizobium hipponense]TYO61768.1 transposase family protein [Bradyrhizobium hipponense]
MRTSSFSPGVLISIEGDRFTLIDECSIEGEPHWALRNESGVFAGYKSKSELEYLYDVSQTLVFVRVEDEQLTPKKRKRVQLIADLPEGRRKRRIFRRRLIEEVTRHATTGCTSQIHGYVERNGRKQAVTVLAHIVTEAARKVGLEVYGEARSCSVATYYRYCALDPENLDGVFENRGNHNQLDPRVKQLMKRVMGTLLEAAKFRKKRGNKPVLTMREIMVAVLDGLKALRAANSDCGTSSVQKSLDAETQSSEMASHKKGPLRMPSPATFYNIYNTFPARSRDVAKYGLTRARSMYRRPGELVHVDAPLSCLQFDETPLPLFVVDEVHQIPLGRPWLAFHVDEYSDAIVGFFFGFEPPGDLVIAATTRHACSMKGYVRQEYPDIDKPYLMGGIGRHFTFDNSLQALGRSIESMTLQLDCGYNFTPSRSPWVKGLVEGTFDIVNDTFLREMPGYVLPLRDKIDKHDYDPQKNAVIGFRHLLWLWHHWLLTIHHALAPRTGIKASINDRWLEGIRHIKPTFLDRSSDLNLVFGIERKGRWTLDHRGVVYEGLRYYSDGLDILRSKRGASQEVRVKVNPLDLLWIHVWDDGEELWVPAKAREEHYAKGLDLHCHKLIRRHAVQMTGRDDLEAWVEAHAGLQHLIQNALPDALSIGIQSKIARAIGVNTANLFRNMQHDGSLIVPPGSPPDLPLHPLRPMNDTFISNASAAEPTSQKPRPIPQFKADSSLGNAD